MKIIILCLAEKNKKIKFYTKKINFDKIYDIHKIDKFWDKFLEDTYEPAEIGGRKEALLKLAKLIILSLLVT